MKIHDGRRELLFASLSEQLLKQIKATGCIALALAEPVPDDILDRTARVAALLDLLERGLGLRFEQGETSYIYNTAKWPKSCHLGGVTDGSDNDPSPSTVVESYFMFWMFASQCAEENASSFTRPLKGSLSVCHREGLKAAISYLYALCAEGMLIRREDLLGPLAALFEASCVAKDQHSIPSLFIPGFEQLSAEQLSRSPVSFDDSQVDRSNVSEDALWHLIDITHHYVDVLRRSRNLDDWIVGQCTINSMIVSTQAVLRRYVDTGEPTIKAMLDTIEEIKADSGGFARTVSGRITNPLTKNCLRIQADTVARGLQLVDRSNWKERLFQDRAIVPDLLRGRIDDLCGTAPLSPEWERLSALAAVPYSSHLNGTPVSFVPVRKPSLTDLEQSDIVSQVLDEFDLTAAERHYSLKSASAESEHVSPELIERMLSQIDKSIPDGLRRLEAILRAKKFEEPDSAKELKALGSQAVAEYELEYLDNNLRHIVDLNGKGLHRKAETMANVVLSRYPWNAWVLLERCISLDGQGRYEEALSDALNCLLCDPDYFPAWKSLSIVLLQLGRREESKCAEVIHHLVHEYLVSRGKA